LRGREVSQGSFTGTVFAYPTTSELETPESDSYQSSVRNGPISLHERVRGKIAKVTELAERIKIVFLRSLMRGYRQYRI
jgi:hypothetical protein